MSSFLKSVHLFFPKISKKIVMQTPWSNFRIFYHWSWSIDSFSWHLLVLLYQFQKPIRQLIYQLLYLNLLQSFPVFHQGSNKLIDRMEMLKNLALIDYLWLMCFYSFLCLFCIFHNFYQSKQEFIRIWDHLSNMYKYRVRSDRYSIDISKPCHQLRRIRK